jgi:hypothetical protein
MKYSTPWVPLEGIHFADAVVDAAEKAGRFRSLPSPFLLPTGVRMHVSESWSEYEIEFDYVTEERLVGGNFADGLRITFGPKSMRIRRLTWANADIRDSASLHRMVSSALDKFARVNRGKLQHSADSVDVHCKAIKRAVQISATLLIQSLREIRDSGQ